MGGTMGSQGGYHGCPIGKIPKPHGQGTLGPQGTFGPHWTPGPHGSPGNPGGRGHGGPASEELPANVARKWLPRPSFRDPRNPFKQSFFGTKHINYYNIFCRRHRGFFQYTVAAECGWRRSSPISRTVLVRFTKELNTIKIMHSCHLRELV